MNDLLANLGSQNSFLMFFLVLLRIGGFFQTMPIFGSSAIPAVVKVFISIVLAIFLFHFIDLPPVSLINRSWLEIAVLALKEVFLGVLLGLALRVVFFAVLYAMDIVSSMLGMSYASLFNPSDNQQSLLIGTLVEVLAILYFLGLNLHHKLIQTIFLTFEQISPVQINVMRLSYTAVAELLANIFVLGLGLAMPMIVMSILINLTLGFLNRSVPQFNVFLVGSSLILFVAFLMFIISLPIFLPTFSQEWNNQWEGVLDLLGNIGN